MEFLNIGSAGFKEAMNQVIDGGIGNDSITDDTVVKLSKVIRCNEDSEDNISSIMLVYEDKEGNSITDFRNFSGKTAEAYAKQVQAHIWTLNTLGAPVSIDELQETFKEDAKESFGLLYELFVKKFNEAKAKGKKVGIEVEHDLTAQKNVITRYCSAAEVNPVPAGDDDLPF